MDVLTNGHETERPAEAESPAALPTATATPTLAGARVMLRSIGPGDYQRLRALELAPQLLWRWRHTGSTPAPEQWVTSLWNGVVAQYLIVDHRSGDWIGIVAAFQADNRNGHAHV